MTKLQAALSNVQAELKAPKNQRNNFGNYNYRSAEDILEAVKPLLGKDGIVMTISDRMVNLGDRYYVESTVKVTDGEEIYCVTGMAREAEDKKGMDAAQITGAASSYARKYALNGMFCIDDTKDADHYDNTSRVNKSVAKTKTAGSSTLSTVSEEQKDKITELARQLDYTDAEIKAKISSIRSYDVANATIAKLADQVFSKDMQ